MDQDTLQSKLETAGEVMVLVEEFDEPLELHLHDTEIDDGLVTLQLSDGELHFAVEDITGAWKHYHSTAEYGL